MARAACLIVGSIAMVIGTVVFLGYLTKSLGCSPRDHIKRVRR